MGIGGSGTEAAARVLSGSVTNGSLNGNPVYISGNFNVSVWWSAFVGTLVLERSFDAGTTFLPVTFSDGTPVSFTAVASGTWSEPESGMLYRIRCSAWTSGTANWQISQ